MKDINYQVLTTRIIRARAKADGLSLTDATLKVSDECLMRSFDFKRKADVMEAEGAPAREVCLTLMEAATLNCIGVYAAQIASAIYGIPWELPGAA